MSCFLFGNLNLLKARAFLSYHLSCLSHLHISCSAEIEETCGTFIGRKMSTTKLCFKGFHSSSKALEFRTYHVGFTDLYRVQKYTRLMLGEVEAKSLEPDI